MNVKLNKKNKSIIAVWLIMFAVYALLFATVPFKKSSVAVWIAFLFTITSIIASLHATLKAFGKSNDIVSKFYSYPIFKIGVIYVASQIVFSVVIFTVSSFAKIPYWVALLPSVVLLGIATIGFVMTDNVKDIVEKQEIDLKATSTAINMFKVDIEGIIDSTYDSKIKTEIIELAEQFRYSDPVSNKACQVIEADIAKKVTELRQTIQNATTENAFSQVAEIRRLLNERNRICKMNK